MKTDDLELFEAIFNFVKEVSPPLGEEMATFNKLNDLVDMYQMYPQVIKKDKNQSTSIYRILNSNKDHDPKATKDNEIEQ